MKIVFYVVIAALVGCTLSPAYTPETHQLDRANLPAPTLKVTIPNLSSCTDASDKSIQIDPKSPLTVLVHGCNGSAGRFRSLAQLYAFHGQQAVCYSYDDRKSLVDGAEKLTHAVNALSDLSNNQKISIIGHSMGGLVARKAMEAETTIPNPLADKNIELITISAPLSGIKKASHCGIEPLHWLTVGIIPGICWLVTGDNWTEISASADFIRYPKPLLPSIDRYLKIVTNEEDTCRQTDDNGNCIESDYVFSLPEQYHPKIDSDPQVTGVQVKAGHVEIVGNKQVVPRKLLAILQEYGALSHTQPERQAAFEKLLADLY